ncbi:MAG: threonine-phosphate decarboxylase CobD [Omnitrophica bacterium]|nr:threonine-phosphate decarboxylase CobD [Candidatus Omnitrophota bacterium]
MANVTFRHGGNIYGLEKNRRKGVIDFSANINPLGLPLRVKRAVCENFNRILHYPDPEAKGITRAISKYWKINEENILVGNGSIELIYLITSCFKPKTTLIPAPTFSEYERAARTVKSKVKILRLKESEAFNCNILGIGNSDMFFLCNPNNPTGNLLIKTGRLIDKFPAKLCVIDEAFMDFLPDQKEHTLIPRAVKSKKIAVLRTLTKFFALPGLRIGYLVAHKEIISKLRECQPPWSVNSLAQLAGRMILADRGYIRKTCEFIVNERNFLFKQITKIEGLTLYPSFTNFILIKIENNSLTSTLLVKKLIQKSLLVRDCVNFKGLGNKFIRIAVRTRKENIRLLKALDSIVVSYR